MTIANFAPLSLSLTVDNPMMDGEVGDYFFPLGVTQEAAEEEGEKGEEGDHPGRLGISHDARLRSLMISAELANDKWPNCTLEISLPGLKLREGFSVNIGSS